ncbi:hypothetical protein AC629_39990 [Bradyrhizobium sp. NAS80.1]|nr:hypothetical protein AC629_39990 [Bradyrhizobium sp. NAS80.1]
MLALGLNATVRRSVVRPGVGVMPVTVAVVGVTVATAVPVAVVKVVPLVKNGTGPGFAVTFVKAAAIVGVTPVTTVAPGAPVTSATAFVKVGVTLVTQVAAEAEDNSAALRPPTENAARNVWFGPDSNIANDQVVALRSTIDVLIRAPQRSARDLESRA